MPKYQPSLGWYTQWGWGANNKVITVTEFIVINVIVKAVKLLSFHLVIMLTKQLNFF